MSRSSAPTATVTARTTDSDRTRKTVRAGGANLNGQARAAGGQARAAGDELARLAAAAETPGEADRLLADTWSRLTRLKTALRRQSEALAIERRRTHALRIELRRVRHELAEPGPDRAVDEAPPKHRRRKA